MWYVPLMAHTLIHRVLHTHTELFYTERNHLRNLKIMHRVYYMKMLSEPSWISKDLVRLLFPNLEEMIMLHGTSARMRVLCASSAPAQLLCGVV